KWRLARMDLDPTQQAALGAVAADGVVDPEEYKTLDPASQAIAVKYGTVFLKELESFAERVREDLWEGLCHKFPELLEAKEATEEEDKSDPATWLAEEGDYHERFMESRLTVFEGRASTLEKLTQYAEGDAEKPCLVSGPSGSGKSALLARFVQDYRKAHGEGSVLAHFVGASPWSTDLRMVLRRLCLALQAHFGAEVEIPEDIPGLTVALRQILGDASEGEPIVVVLDALNQLDESNRAQELAWLPYTLPPTVRLICTCIDDPGTESPALDALRRREAVEIAVEPLSNEEREAIIHEVPSVSAKTLDDAQVKLLLGNPATCNPLFLLVALEELRGFGSFEQLNHRIASFPTGEDATTAIFEQVIERLEDDFGKGLVHRVLTRLGAARRGLSDRELRDLTSDVDPLDDLFPVLRQLRPYLLKRGGLVDFYHRSLYKAVGETYFGGDGEEKASERKAAHAALADYFDGQDYFTESLEEQRARAKRLPPTPRPANIRKVDELPWQRLQAEQWDALADLLMNWQFLEAKAEAQP
ncbi:ATP-binding protein, partial [bacterium]|nr:ATP-binding protein [bacterium]